MPLLPEVGTSFWAGRGDMVGTTCGVGGNTPVKELGICPSDGPAGGLGTALLSQPCQCEGSQAVWQKLSCEVLRDWVDTAWELTLL